MEWDGEEGINVDVKALRNSSVQINIEDIGYEKTVRVSGNDYLKKEREGECRFGISVFRTAG